MSLVEDRFKILFKKYRLKAEISTLSELGHLLAEKGFIYEDSIFSHWQKGSRVPQNRAIILKLIEIFFERGALATKDQADQFLASANQGYLSEIEIQKLGLLPQNYVFQVPNEISNFTGRKKIIDELVNKESILGKVVLIHGPAGIGKTALAIKLAHLLKDKYADGVLWYKIEEDNISDIFESIAKVSGEDISGINDLQVRGTVVRSLLAGKNILLVLDSAELSDKVNLLIPNSRFCTTIITSQTQHKIPINYLKIELSAFTDSEVLSFFKNVLREKYKKISSSNLLKVSKNVGNLPLAVHILARNLSLRKNISNNPQKLTEDLLIGDENLNSAISLSYNKLDTLRKSLLVSTALFKGKDFSAKSISYINGLSMSATLAILESLVDLSLLEHSIKNRYRIHPAIKDFVRDKLDYPRSSYLSLIATLIFGFFAIWWICLQLFIERENVQYYLFSGLYGLLALYGGICGINTSLKWGGLKTLLGKSVFMFSLGLFAQVFGQIVYSYYANFHQEIAPYPSIGDIGFFGTIPIYGYGAVLLAESSGIKINIRTFRKKIIAVIIPIITLGIGYIIYLQDYKFNWNNPVKLFIDFGQPFGTAIVISIVILIYLFSRNILDGIMQSKARLVLFAMIAQFFADYLFFRDSANFYSGNYMDFFYLLAYFTMTIALLSFRSLSIKIY